MFVSFYIFGIITL